MKNKILGVCFGLLFLVVAAGCGGGGGGPGSADLSGGVSEEEGALPAASLPEGAANAEIFDIWTFKTGETTHNCQGNGNLVTDPDISEQEIRIEDLGFGTCKLNGTNEQGDHLLAKNGTIFSVFETSCRVGGDIVVLERVREQSYPVLASSGCTLRFHLRGRFTLSGDNLGGPLVGVVSFSGGQCPPDVFNCHLSTQVEGVRGRQIVDGFDYLSPPPQPGPAPAPEPQPQPAPQQPAPSPIPPALVSDLNTDAIRNIVDGWLRRGGREGLPEADVVEDGADDVPSVPPNVLPVPVR